MWGKSKKHPKQAVNGRFDTLISNKTHLKGDVEFSGGLHIDGKITGNIRSGEDSEAVVRVSDLGVVEGDVMAPHVIINGRVNGDVYSTKHIELAAKASIQGNVYYNLIEMAMGAEVNGNLVHKKDVSAKAAAADPAPGARKPEPASDKGDRKKAGAVPADGASVTAMSNATGKI